MNGTPSNACAATSPARHSRTNASRSTTAGRSCIDSSTPSVTAPPMSCSTPSNSCGTSVCRTPSGQPPAVQIGNPADLASPASPPLKCRSLRELALKCRSLRELALKCRSLRELALKCRSLRELALKCRSLRELALKCRSLRELALKCRSLRELAHSSRRSSPISPRARPAASITPAHRRSIPASPTSGLPITDLVLTAPARRSATAPLRLASRALRSPAPSRLPDMPSCLPVRNHTIPIAIRRLSYRFRTRQRPGRYSRNHRNRRFVLPIPASSPRLRRSASAASAAWDRRRCAARSPRSRASLKRWGSRAALPARLRLRTRPTSRRPELIHT